MSRSEAARRVGVTAQALARWAPALLSAGFPLVAPLQLVRVYGQALTQMADAEVRLFRLSVHEPLMRDGIPFLARPGGDDG
jgi:adenylate cyclase